MVFDVANIFIATLPALNTDASFPELTKLSTNGIFF